MSTKPTPPPIPPPAPAPAQPSAPAPPAAEPTLDQRKTGAHLTADDLLAAANPLPTVDQDLAAKIAAEIEAENVERRKAEEQRRNEGALYYLHCESCEQPALFFTRDPKLGEVFQHADWFSQLKPIGRPWQAGKLRCQNCNAKARARYVGASLQQFVPSERFIRSIPPSKPGVAELLKQLSAFRERQAAKGGAR